jgi:hypothetical protein
VILRLAIRSTALTVLAFFVAWYALLGGAALLQDAFPEVADFAPPPIAAPASTEDWPEGWPIAVGAAFVAAVDVVALTRSRRSYRRAAQSTGTFAEEQLWAEHLAWLETLESARAHTPFWLRRVVQVS